MKDTKDFSWEVVEALGNFSEERKNYTRELNLISWNGAKPVYDIRGWRIGKDGIKHPLKGMSLNREELMALRDLLLSIDLEV